MIANLMSYLAYQDCGEPWMGGSRALESGARPLTLPDEG